MNDKLQSNRFRWWVLLIASIAPMCGMMASISFSPLIGEVSKDLGIGLGVASFGLVGVPTFATAIGIGVCGFLIDVVGVFPVIIGSQLLLVVSGALIPVFGSNYGALVAIRIIQGLSGAGLSASITPAIALWFPRHEMGRAIGFPSVGASLGMILGLTVAPRLALITGSWQVGMALLSGVVFISLLVTVPVAIKSKQMQTQRPWPDVKDGYIPQTSSLFHMLMFWVGLLTIALAMWTNMAFSDLTPGFLAVAPPVGAGYGAEMAGRFMSLSSITGILGALIAGFLIDKVFRGKNRFVVMIGWSLSAIFFTAVIFPSIHNNQFVLSLVLLLTGLQNPFINVTMMSFAAKIFSPHIVGRVCGLWMSVSFFSGSAGVMIGAVALHATGTYKLSILILTMASLIGLAISPLLKQPSSEPM
jgi:MFS family permease